jgi:hypothetical protein
VQSWQHHALAHNVTNSSMVITILNNDGSALVNRTKPSNGLAFQLTLPPSKLQSVALLTVLDNPSSSHPISTNAQGSHQLLPNGNHLLSYGQIPVGREYGPMGGNNNDVRWQARFGQDNLVQNYRLFKQDWSAIPTRTKPSLFVEESGDGCYFAYASWNGATCIRGWDVYEGKNETVLEYVGRVEFKGFETRFIVGGPVVQVVAIIENGVEYKSDIVII